MTTKQSSTPVLWLLPAVVMLASAAIATAAEPARFVFDRLNRTYSTDGSEMAPVERGGVRIELSSPENTLTLSGHTLEMEPAGDGSHRGRLEVEFSGSGRLVGKIGVAGMASDLEDELVVPLQTKTFEGRVEIERVDGGFSFTALELPATVEVAIESRLARQFVGLCQGFSSLPLIKLDCAALDGAFSKAVLPMPPPGQKYLLSDEDLTRTDRKKLARYLAKATSQ